VLVLGSAVASVFDGHAREALPFNERVFGWTTRLSEMGEGSRPASSSCSTGRASPAPGKLIRWCPAEVPTCWQIYCTVEDVDAAFLRALDLGAQEMLSPQEFPGGRFAIVSDPEGASFGLLKMAPS
jgi:predicted enzyme related to lactoylglutathione lyase